ncbi:MAG: ABC transporter permease [Anaerolineales bacterium]|nr:ABC transporter permease [Anaerolineales bacterium]
MTAAMEWMGSYALLLRWQGLRFRQVMPFVVIVQFFTGIGTVIGFGFLIPKLDTASATYLVTGAPTLTLITLGLVLVPQLVAARKAEGSLEYMWSLPISRMAYLAADLTIWMIATMPGLIVALIVGSMKYDFTLQVSPLSVPVFMLIVLTATTVGYAIAVLSPKPELVNLITNFIIFGLFLFSPINFPAERLPNWLADLHSVLPVKYAADAVRGTLVKGYGEDLWLAIAVLGVWCLIGLGINYFMVTRRK